MAQKLSQITRFKKYILLFFVGLSIFPIYKTGSRFYEQKVVGSFSVKAHYPEIKGKTPVFRVDVQTADSINHILSYLPPEIIDRKNFDEEAARETISYVEQYAKQKNVYMFDPFAQNGFTVTVRLVPRRAAHSENFIYIISEKDPIPAILKSNNPQYSLLTDSLQEDKTFFWTEPVEAGSVTFLRFSEKNTWLRGLTSIYGPKLSIRQQLNLGFNIEIWKRSSLAQPEPANESFPDPDATLFGARESLWNTFGRLVPAKQENVSVEIMQTLLDKRILNKSLNRAFYPYDQKAHSLYEGAPKNPIIR
jgi:hypothetical protein